MVTFNTQLKFSHDKDPNDYTNILQGQVLEGKKNGVETDETESTQSTEVILSDHGQRYENLDHRKFALTTNAEDKPQLQPHPPPWLKPSPNKQKSHIPGIKSASSMIESPKKLSPKEISGYQNVSTKMEGVMKDGSITFPLITSPRHSKFTDEPSYDNTSSSFDEQHTYAEIY